MRILNFALLSLLAISLYCCRCQSSSDKLKEQALKENEAMRAELQKSYSDSTVNLSFCGIKLNEPFTKTIDNAQKEGKIRNIIKINGGGITCKADIFVPNEITPLTVDVKVCSYQDTITSFLIISEDYNTHEQLISLYTDKYNEDASVYYDDDPFGYRHYESDDEKYSQEVTKRSGNYSWIWTFKNQSLQLSNFYEKERTMYVKDPQMNTPKNRYGFNYTTYFKCVTIIYSDLKQCEKVNEYEKNVAETERIEKDKELAKIKESIVEIQEATKRRAENQDI